MPRRAEPLIAGEYYHVYNRGTNRARVFLEDANYGFFLSRLRRYLTGEDEQTSEVSKTLEFAGAYLPDSDSAVAHLRFAD